jgi:hypothetical protein
MRNAMVFGTVALLISAQAKGQGPPGRPYSPPVTQASQSPLAASTTEKPQPTAVSSPPLVENLRTFDPGTLDLAWSDSRWILTADGVALKDFGRKESEGRSALRLARMLRLNQYGTVGSPAPLMEYWLSDGMPPRGAVPGYTAITFDTASLHVEETLGQWCVRDERRILFNFGANANDARQAFAVLHKYGFGQAAVIGQPVPSMLVFLANPYGEATAANRPAHQLVTHDTPEMAARKAEELKQLKERVPGLDAETVAQPALRPLREPNQPRQPFSSNVREYGGDGLLSAGNRSQNGSGENREDRVPFDWRRLQVRLEGNVWQVAAGSFVLASFGPDQNAARRALDAVQYYRFTEEHFVGRPERLFSYFLINGLPPHGVPFGVPSAPFQPEGLKVHEIEGKWALCIGDKPLILLGKRQEEASDLLAVIRRQRFDLLCRIGRPEDGFTFLSRTR